MWTQCGEKAIDKDCNKYTLSPDLAAHLTDTRTAEIGTGKIKLNAYVRRG